MLIYTAATLLSCLLTWHRQKRLQAQMVQETALQAFFQNMICALPLLIVSAARWGVGTDFYYTYLPEFRELQWIRGGGGEALRDELFGPLLPWLSQWGLPGTTQEAAEFFRVVLDNSEAGYRALMELGVWLNGNFRVVIVLTSTLVAGCVFYAIFTQSSSPVLAVYLYVATGNYFLSLNIIRQYVAIGIGLVAVRFIRERRLLPFLICVAAAMFFHTTAVLLLPCYFLCCIEVKPRCAFAAVGVTLVLSGPLGALAAWLMPRVGLAYYARYLGSAWSKDGFEWMFVAINLCVLLFCGHYWAKAKVENPYYVIWYNMTLLGTLALAFSGVLPLMKRVNYYYAAPQFLLLPEALRAEEDSKRRKLMTAALAVAFALETLVAVGIYNKNGVLPYCVLER